MPDELEGPLPVKEAAELDPEPDGAELALAMPLVTKLLADIDVVIGLRLDTGTGVAIEIEPDTDVVVAIETE